MARVAYQPGDLERPLVRGADHLTPVIADDGEQAWVAIVPFIHPPAVGDRFTFRGRAWEIVREKDLTRGYVAHPVTPRICAH